jgi:predicted amidohydrolase YtcJ
MLNVLEKVNRDQSLSKVRWAFDHAETISDANLARVKALGGGIAVQGRMAFAGEYFLERYGKEQTLRSPPIKKMLEMGIPVGLGTDGTRVSSFNPWASYYWTVSGRTVGGTRLYGDENRLDRLTALKLFTQGSAWFSSEELEKGQIKPGQLADFALLDRDILKVDEKQLLNTQSILTVVDGKVRYASDEYKALSPALPKAIPEWSPVNYRP